MSSSGQIRETLSRNNRAKDVAYCYNISRILVSVSNTRKGQKERRERGREEGRKGNKYSMRESCRSPCLLSQ